MATAEAAEPTPRKPLLLWPGVVIVILQWLIRFVVPVVQPEALGLGVIGGVIGGLAVVVWWVFFSRAPWSERLGAVVLMVVALAATKRLVHPSIAGGAMGFLLYVWAIPVLGLALVAGAAAGRGLASGPRRAALAAAILLACGLFTLVRTGGVTSDIIGSEVHWRWTPTPEERLLAQAGAEPAPQPPASAAVAPPAPAQEPPAAKATH